MPILDLESNSQMVSFSLFSAGNPLKSLFSLLGAAGILSACAASTGVVTDLSADYPARFEKITVCSGYGCILKGQFVFSPQEKVTLKRIMESGQGSPSAERRAVATAIGSMEKMARTNLRYKPDVEYSYQKNAGKRGQMDCVDESLNTIGYLKYLYGSGLLKYHKPLGTYAARGLIIDGRYPHKSARMRDNSGTDWTVDSWKGPDGAQPEVMLLSKWYRGRNRASDYRAN